MIRHFSHIKVCDGKRDKPDAVKQQPLRSEGLIECLDVVSDGGDGESAGEEKKAGEGQPKRSDRPPLISNRIRPSLNIRHKQRDVTYSSCCERGSRGWAKGMAVERTAGDMVRWAEQMYREGRSGWWVRVSFSLVSRTTS